jgi:hypothetical protein
VRKKRLILIGIFFLIFMGVFVYFRWSSAIRQPLQFSHTQHVKVGIPCSKCHLTPDTIPVTNECKDCHQDKSFPPRVEWIQVYRVAPDILFSHAKHTGVACSTCHEQFTAPDRWIHESRFKMSFCMDCHADTRAPNECRTCHKYK